GARSTGYPPAVRPTTGDAARPLDDGRTRRQTGSGASCVRSWVAVSSVAHHALRLHRLRPPLIAVQPSHVHACISSPLGCHICSTTLTLFPVSMSATASGIAVCGSGRTRHAIGRVPAWSHAIKPSRKAWTSRESRPCARPFPRCARPFLLAREGCGGTHPSCAGVQPPASTHALVVLSAPAGGAWWRRRAAPPHRAQWTTV